jgi:hypothetical protein
MAPWYLSPITATATATHLALTRLVVTMRNTRQTQGRHMDTVVGLLYTGRDDHVRLRTLSLMEV